VGDTLIQHLDALRARAARDARAGRFRFRRRREERASASFLDEIRHDDALRGWIAPAADLIEADRAVDRGTYWKMLIEAIDEDRKAVRASSDAPSAGAAAAIDLEPGAAPAHARLAHRLARDLEQAMGSCRRLTTMGDRWATPAQMEGVVTTLIGGVAGRVLLAHARDLLPDQSVEGIARFGAERPVVTLAGRRFRGDLEFELPLWSTQKPGKHRLWVEFGVAPSNRGDSKLLETAVRQVADALTSWAAGRRDALIAGGEGWLGLVEGALWDAQHFNRWLAGSSLAEKVARIAALTPPKPGSEKAQGWQLLLRAAVDHAQELKLTEWLTVTLYLDRWDGAGRAALRQELNRQVDRAVDAADLSSGEVKSWLDLAQAAEAGDAQGDQRKAALLARLATRVTNTKSPHDVELLHAWWAKSGSRADTVHVVARALSSVGLGEASLVAALRQALPEDDERRAVSNVLEQGARTLKTQDPAVAGLPLAPLTQGDASSAKWNVDDEVRQRVTHMIDAWAGQLRHSQQHDDWKSLVEIRERLQRVKYCG
jgi:hypothetical protein